jgi:hypothetical protein
MRAVRHSAKLLPRAEKVRRHNARHRSNAHLLHLGGKPPRRNGKQLRRVGRLLPRNERLRLLRIGRAHHRPEKVLPSRNANLRGDSKRDAGIAG